MLSRTPARRGRRAATTIVTCTVVATFAVGGGVPAAATARPSPSAARRPVGRSPFSGTAR